MKKYLFASALSLASLCACAQYKVTGRIEGLAEGMVYLQVHGKNADSTMVKDGCFQMAGKASLEAPTYVVMSDNKSWMTAFWMGNDTVEVTGKVNEAAVVKGSPVEDEYQEYTRWMTPIWDEGRKLVAEIKEDASNGDSLIYQLDSVYRHKEDSVFMIFARKHPASYITLNHIYNWRVLNKYSFQRYSEYAKVLDAEAFKGEQWETFRQLYSHDHALQPGQPMPAFCMDDVYGKKIDLAQMKGKCLLFTISNYGVTDYMQDLALRRELYDKYRDQGLEMVDYVLSNDLLNIIKVAANYDAKWRFVTDLKGWNGPWLKDHSIDHITQNWLIGRDGTIVSRDLYGDNLRSEISKMFND